MAGIVAHFGSRSGKRSIEDGMGALGCISGRYHRVLGGDAGVHFGIVARGEWEFAFHQDSVSGITVAVFGFPLKRGSTWRKLSAMELVSGYIDQGPAFLTGLDGSFVVTLVDYRKRKGFFLNDVIGSIPVFWSSSGNGVAFAPEAKVLFPMLGMPATLDEKGLMQFLNTGHLYGDRTMFEGVRRLRPAEIFEIDLDTGSLSSDRYWDLPVADGTGPQSLNQAADALFDVVRDAMRAVPATGACDVAVALTGGYDSRIVLALRPEEDPCRYRSFTWGVRDDIPGSDPFVARSLAQAFDSPHGFVSFEASRVPDVIDEWIYKSELLSDNMGYCAAGCDFLAGLSIPDLVLTGDHVIGLGTIPANRDTAIEAVTTVPAGGISAVLSGVLTDAAEQQVREEFQREIRKILSRAQDRDLKSVQDFLYHQIHAPGWLFSPGFFKEPVVATFRPLMLRPVLELVARMPERLRSDKIVLVRMLRRHLNEASRLPVASAFSLIDWSYESIHNPGLRSFLERQTSEEAVMQTPLGGYLDWDRFLRVRSEFFKTPVSRTSRSRSYVPIAMEVRRWMAQSPALRNVVRLLDQVAPKGIVGRPQERSHRATFRMLFRVAEVTLFYNAVASGRYGIHATNRVESERLLNS